jgi:GR25 family glycosyltransferase involved in LPS biosynthesis
MESGERMILFGLVINLDSRPERLALLSPQMSRHGIEWQRIPAHKAASPQAVRSACFESHRDCWRIAQGRSGPTLIFEDDAVLCSDFSERVTEATGALPHDWQLIHFHNFKVKQRPVNDLVAIADSYAWGAHAYAVTPRGAEALLAANSSEAIDYYLSAECFMLAGVTPYVTTRNFAWQRGDTSDNPIQNANHFYAERFREEHY